MNVHEQIKKYINSQPEQKRSDMQVLHKLILQILPKCKLWFLDGKDGNGKTVSLELSMNKQRTACSFAIAGIPCSAYTYAVKEADQHLP
ncbi:MAG: hypothetical protein JST15_03580 [Bacteroidetes bacterium]|nr:hypothetical protein [Bacteroidota bacterium]